MGILLCYILTACHSTGKAVFASLTPTLLVESTTAILRHFEAAEHEFLRHIEFGYSQITTREVGYPRVHVEVDFQSAITYNDLLDIEVSFRRSWGNLVYVLVQRFGGRPSCTASGKIVVVAMNPATKKSCPVPDDLAAALKAHQIQEAIMSNLEGKVALVTGAEAVVSARPSRSAWRRPERLSSSPAGRWRTWKRRPKSSPGCPAKPSR